MRFSNSESSLFLSNKRFFMFKLLFWYNIIVKKLWIFLGNVRHLSVVELMEMVDKYNDCMLSCFQDVETNICSTLPLFDLKILRAHLLYLFHIQHVKVLLHRNFSSLLFFLWIFHRNAQSPNFLIGFFTDDANSRRQCIWNYLCAEEKSTWNLWSFSSFQ